MSVINLPGVGVAGLFTIKAIKADGSERLLADWQDNLITDAGLDALGGYQVGNGFGYACRVGSGSTPPANTDTALAAFVAGRARKSQEGGRSASSPYYAWERNVYEFPTGTAAGNLSEIGLAGQPSPSGSDPIFTHALIKDGSGNPTTITVLPDEILQVTYEIRYYGKETDTVQTLTIKGVSTTVTSRLVAAGSSEWNGAFGMYWTDYVWGCYWFTGPSSGLAAITATYPAGDLQSQSSVFYEHLAYTPGNHYRDTVSRGNLAFMAGQQVGAARGRSSKVPYQVAFSPRPTKTSSETIALTMRYSWSRYTP